MKTSIVILASASTLTMAQNFFSSNDVPQCAIQCQQLNNAQTLCLPPTSPQPTSCFCSSSLLTSLASAPASVCPGCTSQSDLSQLAGWFTRFCQQGGSATYNANGAATSAPASAATTVVSSVPAASTAAAANPAATSNTASSGSSSSSDSNGSATISTEKKSWWDLHKGWIAMVIVLVIAFAAIIAGAVWWKKRYLRRRDAAGATLPGAWGPTQNQHPSDRHAEKSGQAAQASAFVAEQPRKSKKNKIPRALRR